MQNKNNDLELDDTLLNNSLLFSSIRKNKSVEDKIAKINKYLDRGADINARDANFKNNTPLHVAVTKEEPEVVIFLLERGALANIKNSDNQTALDIARMSTCKRKNIKTILEEFKHVNTIQHANQRDNDISSTMKSTKIPVDPKNLGNLVACDIANLSQPNVANHNSITKNRKQGQSKSKQQQLSKQLKKTKRSEILNYQKRTGTSGLSGQLYETKLLSLILFRALYVHKVKPFLLATNVQSLGAFDDIVFKFHSNKTDQAKIIFVQAKHRDNPAKDKITVEEIMKLNGDFSLHKYLESFIQISQMFDRENSDNMFRGNFKTMDCEFVICTPVIENFSKKKNIEHTEGKCFINTGKGEVFQFDYDDQDVELLAQTVTKSRAILLAKRLSKFIFRDNQNNMMEDDIIKTYHVFLAQHVLAVQPQDGEWQNNFHYAKFQESFFTSNDNLLMAFKSTICKEVLLIKKIISIENPTEVESLLISLTFKVPLNFGNLHFSFDGSEQRKEKKLKCLCSIFELLFNNANVSEYILMKVDDDMVGSNEILQSSDIESSGLGDLVGNLLVFDNVTKTLKFNSNIRTLSEDNLKILEKIKSDVFIGIDLSKCRFDINLNCFPRLSLVHEAYDRKLIKEFLRKLIFYTNQATEDEVEKILKDEIDNYFVGSKARQNDALFRVKGDAIFLKVHDRMQKWWKQPINAPYLTEFCEYYFEAEQDILNSPLLSVLNFTYTESIKNALPALKFKDAALESLHLDIFFAGVTKILSIISEENGLSSIKLIQYFKERNFNDYTFIELSHGGLGNYFVDVKTEIIKSKINTLIVVCKSKVVIAEIYLLIKHFLGKIIIVSNQDLVGQISGLASEDIVERVDSQIGFKDLADTVCKMLLEERYVVFQGKEVPFGTLFEDESYHLINAQLLNMIINNNKPAIGNSLNNPSYDECLDFYINEQVCRYITLDPHVRANDKLNILKYSELEDNFIPDTRDIILITDKDEEFAEFILKHDSCNVHWFSGDKSLVWKKSRGKLDNILKHIHRGEHDAHTIQPLTLKDVRENVVIISGEPGMGKSSYLTHLAINTKHKYPVLWISKINLLENTNVFKKIKENKVNIDFKETVIFLFSVIGFEAFKDNKVDIGNIINQISVTGDEISFNKSDMELNITGINLFEIELFIHCYNNNRVVLLFDGFDEICPDFANEFMEFVNILKKTKVVHIWITSRVYNVLHQLENTLETFSFTIQPLSYDDQLEFLEKIWSRKLKTSKRDFYPFNKPNMNDLIKVFLWGLSDTLRDTTNKFISIPLHLYMISEVFQDSFHNFLPVSENVASNSEEEEAMNEVNLNKIYERFVDIKFFKIRFGEKKPLLCIDDPDMRQLIDNERAAFCYVHKIIAAYVVFGKSDQIELFDSHDINEIRNFFETIQVGEEKTGIIQQIVQNEPKFVHYTFAEYFATEFLCDRLKSFHIRTAPWMFLINTFLQSEEGGPRRFFNAKLENQPLLFDEVYSEDLNEMFEALLLQHRKMTKVLFMALDESLENTAVFLLKCLKIVVRKDNLTDFIHVVTKSFNESCIVCTAIDRSAKKFITLLIELIKDIDANRLIDLFYCADLPNFNPLVLVTGVRYSLCWNVDFLNVLLSDLTPSALVDLFCLQIENEQLNTTAAKKVVHIFTHSWVTGDLDREYFAKVLGILNGEQLLTIFCAKDSENKSAAHRAAEAQHYLFFEKLDSLLDRHHFIEVCMNVDDSGLTPIHYFEYTEKYSENLKNLLDKVYDVDTNEKLTLNYFIDKKTIKS